MALRWQWNEKGGEVTFKNGDVYPWYEGNGLMIVLNEWQENEETYWSMFWFFADKEHAKNMLGLSKGHENCFSDNPITEITINRKWSYQWKDLVTLLTKAFPDIRITLHNGGTENE